MHFAGIEDEAFIRGNVPMTKREIRILTLAQAKIMPDDIVTDIGAGTGSLSIEAALSAPKGKVYAIERKEEGVRLIRENAAKFDVHNLEIISGHAPASLTALPLCDVIFIGGSGQKLIEILDTADRHLKPNGRLIVNTVTIETLYTTINYIKRKKTYTYEAFQVQVDRFCKTGSYHMLQAQNPITIITCNKQSEFEEAE